MQKFLERVAQYSLNSKITLENLLIVLPNRRAKVHLVQHFQKQLNKVSWLPTIKSLEDFVQDRSSLKLIDPIDLLIAIYDIHKSLEGKEADNFEDFVSWGQILLHDFNEIDRYLVDGAELYNYLSEAKAIENWNLNSSHLSQFQKNYLRFWNSLGIYYKELRSSLLSKGEAYQGLLFEQALSKLDVKLLKEEGFEKIYFTGFNAMAVSEERLMNYFVDEGVAEFLWDSDEYYMNNEIQEAGKFLRKFKKKQNNFQWIFNDFKEIPKEIEIFGVSGNMGQAKFVANVLKNKKQSSISKTALILSDEEILPLIIESLPPTIDSLNITMGYPLNQSIFFDFVSSFFKLYESSEINSKSNAFYYKNLLYLLDSRLFHFTSDKLSEKIKSLGEYIINESRITVSSEEIKSHLESFAEILPSPKSSGLIKLEALKSILDLIDIEKVNSNSFLHSQYQLIVKEVEDILATIDNRSDLQHTKSLFLLLNQKISLASSTLKGEPLDCLQIMGVLESRTLDFEEVIISSLNEGILPAGKSQNSFIPFDIKKKFGLPSYQDKDAIFSYHFYRILQRAKKITLIYNQKVDTLMGGEKSRFIMQILHELNNYNKEIKISERSISPNLINYNETPNNIYKKDNTVLEIIQNRLFNKGISASAINTYLNCRTDFYYKYVLGLRGDSSDNIEELDAGQFGEVIHQCLEDLYQPYLNEILSTELIQKMQKEYLSTLNKSFKTVYRNIPKTGEPKILYEVAKKIIADFLLYELEFCEKNEVQLIGIEKELFSDVELELPKSKKKINLKIQGKIDRIDKVNGEYRIIDYKTSKVESSDFNSSSNNTILNGSKSKLIQLWIYKLLCKEISEDAIFKGGMIPLKNPKLGVVDGRKSNDLELAKEILAETIENILDPNDIMEHNEKSEYCSFC